MQRKMRRQWQRAAKKKMLQALVTSGLILSLAGLTFANPTGGTVTGGAGTISSSGNTTTINQTTDKLAINWDSFNIGRGEAVNFVQPGSASIALNRILGNDATTIYGSLNANGQIFLINPNGVVFAKGAAVDVGGLVASTLDISNSDFLNGNYTFSGDGGLVLNQGTITATDGGYVALLGAQAQNDGVIIANQGTVALASGNAVTLDLANDGFLNLAVDQAALAANASNNGLIQADGGRVYLTARTAAGLAGTVVNNGGTIEARSLKNVNGAIYLDGGTNGAVVNSGTLDASGTAAGQTGGAVKVLGATVTLADGTKLDVNGAAGGGTALVGGNYQGGGTEQHATTTTVASGAAINANALTDGNGGTVVVWSDQKTDFAGTITATGGSSSGKGGQVETSSKGTLKVADTARVTTTAAQGATGSWLLDPADFTIGDTASGSYDMDVQTLAAALGSSNVTITTGADSATVVNGAGETLDISTDTSSNGDITVDAALSWDSTNTLTLSAYNNINLNAAITAPKGGLTLAAGTATAAATSATDGNISAPAAINVGIFSLQSGTWNQLGSSLPTFSATDFRISGGKFIRALGGDGTSATPYQLTDVYGLQGVGSSGMLNNYYYLGNNIDASGTKTWNGGAGFAPIGIDDSNKFGGLLEGDKKTISNLSINNTSNTYVGLFGITDGTIRNVGLVNATVTGSSTADNSTRYVGGLVGENDGNIVHCYSTGAVSGSATGSSSVSVGGLAGLNTALITSSYSTGAVNGSATGSSVYVNVGGLAGGTGGPAASITSCYSTGAVSGSVTGSGSNNSVEVGGLAGATGGIVTSCYSTGAVNGSATGSTADSAITVAVGGLTGWHENGDITFCYSTGTVSGSNVGSVDGSNITVSVGGLAGYNYQSKITSCYWDTATSGLTTGIGGGTTSGANVSVTGLATADLMKADTYSTWTDADTGYKFSDYWSIINGVSYPYLNWQFSGTPQVISGTLSGLDGKGISGATVQSAVNGTLLADSSTGANGFYYQLVADGSVKGDDLLVAYVTDSADDSVAANGVYQATADAMNFTGMDLADDTVSVYGGSASTALNVSTVLADALTKGLTETVALYTVDADTGAVYLSGRNLALTAGGDLVIDKAITTSGALTVAAGTATAAADNATDGAISAPAAINVGKFTLQSGTWSQIGEILPTFSATDFRIGGGKFIRALGGDGSSTSTAYQLTDIYGLQGVGSSGMLGNYYVLAKNIDASGTQKWNNGAGFAPIGPGGENIFTGTFNGQGQTISNLLINNTSNQCVGLFGYVNSTGTIQNVGLVNASVTGSSTAANSSRFVGGLAGYNGGTITSCYSTGAVSGSATGNYNSVWVGGLAGWNDKNITSSYSTGLVSGVAAGDNQVGVGGLAGRNDAGAITSCYSTSAVGGSGSVVSVGGLAGVNNALITSSYSTGAVSGVATGEVDVGGLAGRIDSGSITSCYWDTATSGKSEGQGIGRNNGGTISVTGLATADMMKAANYTSWDSSVWNIIDGVSYPYLNWQFSGTPQVISGTVRDSAGAAISGATVQSAVNGTLLANSSTGANGFYYQLVDGAAIGDGDSLLTYVADNASVKANGVYQAADGTMNFTGMNMADEIMAVYGGSTTTALDVSAAMTKALGNLKDSDVLYKVDADTGAVSVSGDLTINPNLTVKSTDMVSAEGKIYLGGIGLGGDISLTSSGGSITVASALGWSTDATLTLSAYQDIKLYGAITATNGGLTLNAYGGDSFIDAPAAVKVGTFILQKGTWNQDLSQMTGLSKLPDFSATDFRISGGTFIRVLDGNASAADPYQITDIYGLQGIGSISLSGCYVLANDIDASVTKTWNDDAGFVPLGSSYDNPFTGTFDGAGHKISDLLIKVTANGTGSVYAGLFGRSTGTIKNVGLVNAAISASYTNTATDRYTYVYVGGLAGLNDGAINSCYSTTGTVSGAATDNSWLGVWVGGLVGSNQGTLASCYSSGVVSGEAINNNSEANTACFQASVAVGGLVGFNNSSFAQISSCYSNATVSGSATSSAIKNSYANPANVAEANVGGLTGYNNNGAITSSYSTGGASGSATATRNDYYSVARVGGLAGYNNAGTITSSYSTGAASGSSKFVYLGGLVGYNNTSGAVTSCYWDTETSGRTDGIGGGTTSGDKVSVTGLATEAMKKLGATSGWNATDWKFYDGYTYPLLKAFLTPLVVTVNVADPDNIVTYNGKAYDGLSGGYSLADVDQSLLLGELAYTYLNGGKAAESAKNAGSYTIGATGLYSNQQGYDITYVNGALTIEKAKLTVTATGANKIYDGTIASNAVAKVSGLQTGDTLTDIVETYNDRNVGDKTLTIAGYKLNDGNNGGNYDVVTESATGTIGKATLTITAATDSKTYDGTIASNAAAKVSGLQTGDTLTDIVEVYNNRNAGTKTLTIASYNLKDGNEGGNYEVKTESATGTIGKATLTIAAATDSKTYDGTNVSKAAATYTGLQTGDTLTDIVEAYNDKNAGTKTLAVTSYKLNDGNNSGNYNVVRESAAGTIGKVTLTITAATDSKTYDGTAASDAAATYSGLIAGDTLTDIVEAYNDKNAGAKTLTVASYNLNDGNNGGNYNVVKESAAGTIGKATLTISAASDSKTYDGTAVSDAVAKVSGLQTGDTLTDIVEAYNDKNAGAKTLTIASYNLNDGNNGGNYNVVKESATGTIGKAKLTITAATDSKTYDGTNVSNAAAKVSGLQTGDTLTDIVEAYNDKNAGTKTLTVTGYKLIDGNNGGNYNVVKESATGTIGKATLTIAAATDSKTYDGTNVSKAAATYTGLQTGDTLTDIVEAYNDKNAGTKTLAVTSYKLNDGNNGGNYNVVRESAAGTIGKATLTITAATDSKTYDGTAASDAAATYSGLIAGDTLTDIVEAYNDKNAGAKTLTVASYNLNDGNNGGNYNVVKESATGTIGKATLTISAASDSKTYDGTAASDAVAKYTGLQTGDTLTDIVETYNDRNAGDKTLTVASYNLNDGNNGGNYNVTTESAAGTIDKASLIVTANNLTKTTGEANPALTASYSGLATGDTVDSLAKELNLVLNTTADTNSAAGKYAITLSGATEITNYTVAYVDGTLTVIPNTPYTAAVYSAGQTAIAANDNGNTDPRRRHLAEPFVISGNESSNSVFNDLAMTVVGNGLNLDSYRLLQEM